MLKGRLPTYAVKGGSVGSSFCLRGPTPALPRDLLTSTELEPRPECSRDQGAARMLRVGKAGKRCYSRAVSHLYYTVVDNSNLASREKGGC